MRITLVFQQAADERFLVTAAVDPDRSLAVASLTSQTLYDHEDLFLSGLIAAELEAGPTQELAIAAILSVARPDKFNAPVHVDVSPEQAVLMGLNLPCITRGQVKATEPHPHPENAHPFSFHASPEVFHDFLMNAPTPFVMVTGPEHTFTFINPPYVRILGRRSMDQILGRPILEAIPELCGQTCLALLDNAYQTGAPQVRKELLNRFRQEETGRMEEVYFDIVYHPMRDRSGNVTGVMAQAMDVTERVLARQVSEHREQKLYRLWAELEAIYHLAPIGLAVIDANAWTLLRLNRLQAALLGGSLESLTGTPLAEVPSIPTEVMKLLRQAAAGAVVKDVRLETQRAWQVSIRATLNASGAVETLVLLSQEVAPALTGQDPLCESYLPVS
jgi:PAS domain S-box-containing protein